MMEESAMERSNWGEEIGILGRHQDLIIWIYDSMGSLSSTNSNHQALYGGMTYILLNKDDLDKNKEEIKL